MLFILLTTSILVPKGRPLVGDREGQRRWMKQTVKGKKKNLPRGVLGIGGEGVGTEKKQCSESIVTSLARNCQKTHSTLILLVILL